MTNHKRMKGSSSAVTTVNETKEMTAWRSIRIIFKWCCELKRTTYAENCVHIHLKERSADSLSMRLRERQEKMMWEMERNYLAKQGRKRKKKESGFKACFFPPAL